jgi:hypothetical protein
MWPRLVSNSWSSCFCLPSARITDEHHYTQWNCLISSSLILETHGDDKNNKQDGEAVRIVLEWFLIEICSILFSKIFFSFSNISYINCTKGFYCHNSIGHHPLLKWVRWLKLRVLLLSLWVIGPYLNPSTFLTLTFTISVTSCHSKFFLFGSFPIIILFPWSTINIIWCISGSYSGRLWGTSVKCEVL